MVISSTYKGQSCLFSRLFNLLLVCACIRMCKQAKSEEGGARDRTYVHQLWGGPGLETRKGHQTPGSGVSYMQLWAIMWLPGTKPKSAARTVSALNHCVISTASNCPFNVPLSRMLHWPRLGIHPALCMPSVTLKRKGNGEALWCFEVSYCKEPHLTLEHSSCRHVGTLDFLIQAMFGIWCFCLW